MIRHTNFESDCKRIAQYIMKQAKNPSSEQFNDMVDFGQCEVIVSKGLLDAFNVDRDDKKKKANKWAKEINKHLKGCSVTYKTVGYGHGWFIIFDIEFDDVDAETEDW